MLLRLYADWELASFRFDSTERLTSSMLVPVRCLGDAVKPMPTLPIRLPSNWNRMTFAVRTYPNRLFDSTLAVL